MNTAAKPHKNTNPRSGFFLFLSLSLLSFTCFGVVGWFLSYMTVIDFPLSYDCVAFIYLPIYFCFSYYCI